jgi:hypothetical protein
LGGRNGRTLIVKAIIAAIRPFVIGIWLALAPPLAATAEPPSGEPSPAEMVDRAAKNPDEHRALAAYFSEKAKAARRDANVHHQMELSYNHVFPTQKMAEHCRALVALDKQMAREYEELARAHAAEAEK